VLVVLGAEAERVRRLVDGDVVVVDDWSEGIGASVRRGLAALGEGDATACVVALVDQPLVGADAVRRLVAATGTAAAAVATYDGAPRHPVLLSRAIWPAVSALAIGDVGARGWLRAHRDQVTHVPCDGTGSAQDVDTPESLDAMRRLLG
jgi:molybdenum cofactor cytidylyltransferase/nicotine blue oxidoreductase